MADLPYFLQRNPPARLNLVVDSGFPVRYGEAGMMNWRMTYDEPPTDQVVSFSAGEEQGAWFPPPLPSPSRGTSARLPQRIFVLLPG